MATKPTQPDKGELINSWDQCKAFGGDRILIYYRPTDTGRGGHCSAWIVTRIRDGKETVTDPKAAWYDYGRKVFSFLGRDQRDLHFAQAVAWANRHFGNREFVRNRVGDYVEREVNEKHPLPKRERKVKS